MSVVGRLDEQWETMFDALTAFEQENGHVDVPRVFATVDGRRLGAWLHRQRSLAAAGTIPERRRERLSAAGVRWSLSDRAAGVAAFAEFVDEYGHGRVPHTYRTGDGFPLGTWVQSRRRQWHLDPTSVERLWPELTPLGFEWQVRDQEAGWAAGVAALTAYRDLHGDVAVPSAYTTADGFPLGRWVDSRRVEGRRHVLRAERMRDLNELGMIWRMRLPPDDSARRLREAAHFTAMLRRTALWVAEHNGALPTAREHDGVGAGIGRWLVRQRQLLRSQRLDVDRLGELDAALPGWRTTDSR